MTVQAAYLRMTPDDDVTLVAPLIRRMLRYSSKHFRMAPKYLSLSLSLSLSFSMPSVCLSPFSLPRPLNTCLCHLLLFLPPFCRTNHGSLIISVTGGARSFDVEEDLLVALRRVHFLSSAPPPPHCACSHLHINAHTYANRHTYLHAHKYIE